MERLLRQSTKSFLDINQNLLKKIETVRMLGDDFLKYDGKNLVTRIVANPPFSKNQDIDHIYKMYEVLAPKGRLVTIASNHWKQSTNKKEIEFQNWLKRKNATIIDVEKGEFKESGTMIATSIIVINKV